MHVVITVSLWVFATLQLALLDKVTLYVLVVRHCQRSSSRDWFSAYTDSFGLLSVPGHFHFSHRSCLDAVFALVQAVSPILAGLTRAGPSRAHRMCTRRVNGRRALHGPWDIPQVEQLG